MLVCNDCHRHVRVEALACPFCGATISMISAPSSGRLGPLALTAGLGLLACSDRDGESEGMTTDANSQSGTTLGDGDGDPNETLEATAAEYAGPDEIPCADFDPIPAVVGLNAVTVGGNSSLEGSCGGDGPDAIYSFVAQADAEHTFAVTDATFQATLYVVGLTCFPPNELACVSVPEVVTMPMTVGQTVHVVVDSNGAGGTASLEITTM
jgi:hypothetical protein